MARYELTWIDKDAEEGPLFRIGTKDVYSRPRRGQRVVRLKAIHSPNLAYVAPALQAFRELAEHWGGPIVFIIDPDVKKPPAAQFLFEWSQAAFQNGSVDRSYMVMGNPVTQVLGRFVCRMFAAGGMPFVALNGEKNMDAALDALDLDLPVAGWSITDTGTALVVRRNLGEGAYGQLVKRLFARMRGDTA